VFANIYERKEILLLRFDDNKKPACCQAGHYRYATVGVTS
jgi:hypothetical protein